jgi:hypothetical protein
MERERGFWGLSDTRSPYSPHPAHLLGPDRYGLWVETWAEIEFINKNK